MPADGFGGCDSVWVASVLRMAMVSVVMDSLIQYQRVYCFVSRVLDELVVDMCYVMRLKSVNDCHKMLREHLERIGAD